MNLHGQQTNLKPPSILARLARIAVLVVLLGAAWLVFIVVPNLTGADVKAVAVGDVAADWALILAWSGYLVAYSVLALAAAWLVFRRKEF